MELSNYRYLGRFLGLGDALGIKSSHMSPDDYYALSKEEKSLYTTQGLVKFQCQDACQKLMQLSQGAGEPRNSFEIQEFKKGLREGMMMVNKGEYLMKLTLPTEYL